MSARQIKKLTKYAEKQFKRLVKKVRALGEELDLQKNLLKNF